MSKNLFFIFIFTFLMANLLTESKPTEKSKEILKNEIHDVLIMAIKDLWANLSPLKQEEESTKEPKKGLKEEPKIRNHPIIDSSKIVSTYGQSQNHLLIDFVKN